MRRRKSSALAGHAQRMVEKIVAKQVHVTIVGLGYVGLPLATALGRAGLTVHGIDIDLERISLVNKGISYLGDVGDHELNELVTSGKLYATTAFEVAARSDVIIICVPTPLRKTREPDISSILGALDDLQPVFRRGQLLILESTTYPGTTDEVLLPRLQSLGFTIGQDFFLAFSPERVDPGNRTFTTSNIPKVVGGMTPSCTELAVALYTQVTTRVHPVSTPRAAETAKLLENTFRSVNIALANELALACRAIGVDPWEVIDAAATKPFGFMPFHPGPGTGGHCIPLDPLYLSWTLRRKGFETRFIALADETNRAMPGHVVSLVFDALNSRSRCLRGADVLVLGVTYKRDVGDVRESPALEVIRLLTNKGARVAYSDPYVPQLIVDDLKFISVPVAPETLRTRDCVVIVTDHRTFGYPMIALEAPLIVDARNALRDIPGHRDKIVTL